MTNSWFKRLTCISINDSIWTTSNFSRIEPLNNNPILSLTKLILFCYLSHKTNATLSIIYLSVTLIKYKSGRTLSPKLNCQNTYQKANDFCTLKSNTTTIILHKNVKTISDLILYNESTAICLFVLSNIMFNVFGILKGTVVFFAFLTRVNSWNIYVFHIANEIRKLMLGSCTIL